MNIIGNYKSSITPIRQQHSFSRVPKNNAIEYSTFDRSHRHLTTHDADYLIPFFVDEIYPGDIAKIEGRHLSRLLTPVHPFMDRVQLKTFFFYVPNRIIWNNSKAFFGERRRNDDESVNRTYQIPMLNSGENGVETGSIFDYAGIPVNVPNLEFSAMPFRAMNLCYNEWFRDENLCSWLNVGGTYNTDGEYDTDSEFGDSDDIRNYSLFKISKTHDYFTSALPFQQKGEPSVISLNGDVPVIGNGNGLGLTDGISQLGLIRDISGTIGKLNTVSNDPSQSVGTAANSTNGISSVLYGVTTDASKSGLIAQLTGVPGFSVSDFRTLMQIQALQELSARVGSRYREYVKGNFNVSISDATLDRPEYLGGYTIDLNVVPVANTTGTTSDPQGNLSAFAVTDTGTRFAVDKAFEEHGWLIGFVVAKSDQSYQQGLDRMFSRKNLYDFYNPLLAHISEQEIKMKEILAQGADVLDSDGQPVDEKTFAFQEAWAELRFKNNLITGKMRSTVQDTLDVWHLAPKLEPQIDEETGENLGIPLNQEFIESYTPIDRVVAVRGTDENPQPQFYTDNYFISKWTREVPLYSVPAYLTGRM